jgi:hypothetical protein
MAVRRIGVLILLLASLLAASSALAVDETLPPDDGEPLSEGPVEIAQDIEVFRGQMIDYLQRMEVALSSSMKHPLLTQRIETALASNMLQVPFAPSTYAVFEEATGAELDQLRSAFAQVPGVLEIPEILTTSIDQLLPTDTSSRSIAAACTDNYTEYANAISKQGATRGLTRALDSTAFFFSILNTLTEVVGAATEDTPYVGKLPSLPFVIVRGIFDVIRIAISFARDDLAYQGTLSELCVAACLADTADVHGQPSERWRGRGCDNRDNNCTGGIDELAEDMFAPEVFVDAAVIGQCFADRSSAQAAAELAVKTIDDCATPTSSVTLGAVSPATCTAGFSVMAQDGAGNSTSLTGSHLQLTIDPTPPGLTLPPLNACYPTIDSARNAFTGPGFDVTDCTAVDLAVNVVEKECVADLELTAIDACGNQSAARRSVRVDATPPEIDIARLKIPSVDGLYCLKSEAEAIAEVSAATNVFDRCTATEDLILSTTASGPACNLEVTSTALDECGQIDSDSLSVRVDDEAPTVSCSVEQGILYPATNGMIDVGFQFVASDNCEPDGPQIDIQVTSDEPTALAFSAIDGDDLYPDAVIERATDGTIQGIQLRAQRSTEGKADGRVYRIRVIATDSCGIQAFSDCYVTVPRTKPGPGSAINSGQGFDATDYN